MPEQVKGKIDLKHSSVSWVNPKWVFEVRISGAPLVATHQGEKFQPLKIVFTDWGVRAKVEVFGKAPSASWQNNMRTVMYGLGGYEKDYPAPPDWVLEIIRDAGFARKEV